MTRITRKDIDKAVESFNDLMADYKSNRRLGIEQSITGYSLYSENAEGRVIGHLHTGPAREIHNYIHAMIQGYYLTITVGK